MRRLFTALAMTSLLVATTAPVAAASPGEGVYVSLGTSLAAGSQADASGTTTFSSESSYTDQLHQRLKGRLVGDLAHVKLGCPGETAPQLLGGVDKDGNPSNCAGLYETGSQIGDALKTVAESNVVVMTIDIGSNDLFDAFETCGQDSICLGGEITAIAGKVGQIVTTIRNGGYDGPIVAMNYYNPLAAASVGFFNGVPGQQPSDLGFAILSDSLVRSLNGALAQIYDSFGVSLVDVYAAFNAGDFGDDQPANGIPDNVDVLCRLSFMCPDDETVKPNIHLNRNGYKVVAKEFLSELDR